MARESRSMHVVDVLNLFVVSREKKKNVLVGSHVQVKYDHQRARLFSQKIKKLFHILN